MSTNFSNFRSYAVAFKAMNHARTQVAPITAIRCRGPLAHARGSRLFVQLRNSYLSCALCFTANPKSVVLSKNRSRERGHLQPCGQRLPDLP